MPIKHLTIPADGTTGEVGYAQWAEDHTLPTPAEIGAAPADHTHDYAASDHTHTGGWAWFAWEQAYLRRKRKRDEAEELAERLEARLIAERVIEPVSPPQKVKAFMVARRPVEVPPKVRAAITRAVRSNTAAAYQLALKRIRELEDEEDFAVLLLLH